MKKLAAAVAMVTALLAGALAAAPSASADAHIKGPCGGCWHGATHL